MSGDEGLTTAELADLLSEVFALRGRRAGAGAGPSREAGPDGALLTKIKHLRANGCPSAEGPDRGRVARYGLGDVARLVACFAVMEAGMSARIAAQAVMRNWGTFGAAFVDAARGQPAVVSISGAGLASLRDGRRGEAGWAVRLQRLSDRMPGASGGHGSSTASPLTRIIVDVPALLPRMTGAYAERSGLSVDEVVKSLAGALV